MFIEPHYRNRRNGCIEVICGGMFSGKTEELIRRLRRAQIADQSVKIFKPKKDTRYHDSMIVSHSDNRIESEVIDHPSQLLNLKENVEVIGIDEAQFFVDELVEVCNTLANRGKRILLAGLDMDFKGLPFGPMPKLMAIADYVTKVHAICVHCGSLATHSYRLTIETEQVLLGAKNVYEPRCRHCYQMGNILDFKSVNKGEIES